jgi:hypothetical protein
MAAAAMAAATTTAMVRATLMAKSMERPMVTAIAAVEIEAAGATEKLVAKAGGNYKVASGRHRHQSTKKGNSNGNETAAMRAIVTVTVTVGSGGGNGGGSDNTTR